MSIDLVPKILEFLIRSAGDITCFVLLFRDNLRIPVKGAAACYASYAIIAAICYSTMESEWTRIVDPCLFIMEMVIVLSLFREKRLNSFMVFCSFVILTSCIGSMLQGGLYGLMTLMEGHMEWWVKDQSSPIFQIVAALLIVPAYVAAIFIAQKLKPDMMGVSGPLRIVLLAIIPFAYVIGNITRSLLQNPDVYVNDPSGVGFMIDSVRILLFFAALSLILARRVLWIRRSDRVLEDGREKAMADYREAVRSMRQREHDEANWEAAGITDGPQPEEDE